MSPYGNAIAQDKRITDLSQRGITVPIMRHYTQCTQAQCCMVLNELTLDLHHYQGKMGFYASITFGRVG